MLHAKPSDSCIRSVEFVDGPSTDLSVGLHNLNCRALQGDQYAAAVLAHLVGLQRDNACLEQISTQLARAATARIRRLQGVEKDLAEARTLLEKKSHLIVDLSASLRAGLAQRRQMQAEIAHLRPKVAALEALVERLRHQRLRPARETLLDLGHGWRIELVRRVPEKVQP